MSNRQKEKAWRAIDQSFFLGKNCFSSEQYIQLRLLQTFFAFLQQRRIRSRTEAGLINYYFGDPRGVSNPDICPGSIIGNADDMTAISVLICIWPRVLDSDTLLSSRVNGPLPPPVSSI